MKLLDFLAPPVAVAAAAAAAAAAAQDLMVPAFCSGGAGLSRLQRNRSTPATTGVKKSTQPALLSNQRPARKGFEGFGIEIIH